MQTVGTPTARPAPRRPRRRRLSRRRFIRRIVGFVVVAAVVIVGCTPTLRYLGYVSKSGPRGATTEWQVVKIADDRRSATIRVGLCGYFYAGADARRVGSDVRLTVFRRHDSADDGSKVSCIPFAAMPTHVVQFGFALPVGGRVLGAGYALRVAPPG